MTWFVLAVLAAHRLARLAAVDTLLEGPRARVKVWATDGGDDQPRPVFAADGTVRVRWTSARFKVWQLVSCPHCVGFWCSLAVVGVFDAAGRPLPLPWWLAVWAVAGAQSLLASADHALSRP